MLTEQQYLGIKEWPVSLGGGEQGADVLVSQVLRVFHLTFNQNVTFLVIRFSRLKMKDQKNSIELRILSLFLNLLA